jgi:hypothetical protein
MRAPRGFVRVHLLTLLIWMILASITLGLAVASKTQKVWFEFCASTISSGPTDPGRIYFEVNRHETVRYGTIHPVAYQQRDRKFRMQMDELNAAQLQSEVRALLSVGSCGMRISSPDDVNSAAPKIMDVLRYREPSSIYNADLDWASDLLDTCCLLGIAFILVGIVSEVCIRTYGTAKEHPLIDAGAA